MAWRLQLHRCTIGPGRPGGICHGDGQYLVRQAEIDTLRLLCIDCSLLHLYRLARGISGIGSGMLILILRTKQRVKILAMCVFLAITIYPWIPGEYQERVKSIFVEKESRDDSAASRTVLWRIALRIWQDHPIAGVGLENFSPVKETYSDKVADIVSSEELFSLIFNRQRYPHGMYTGLLAETGLVGTGLLMALLLRSILCRLPKSLSSAVYFQSKGARRA